MAVLLLHLGFELYNVMSDLIMCIAWHDLLAITKTVHWHVFIQFARGYSC